jgi:isopentenyl-diphosphate Delta-isomerase
MDKEDEVFELVNENDEVIGREHRGIVHRSGLLHRAVYAWVFNPAGELLIQRRSPLKKIGANQWDLSVAEHLQPTEDYLTAVVRGLGEELGIQTEVVEVAGPLQPTHKRELHQGEFHDVELVRSYKLDRWKGEVKLVDGEVSEIRWVALDELKKEISTEPEKFTQWMRDEITGLNWFEEESNNLGVKGSLNVERGKEGADGNRATALV